MSIQGKNFHAPSGRGIAHRLAGAAAILAIAGATTVVSSASSAGTSRGAEEQPIRATGGATPGATVDVTIDGLAVAEMDGYIRYMFTLTNQGPGTATNVVLSHPTPSGLTFLFATCGTFPCTIGTLEAGHAVSLHASYRAPAGISQASSAGQTASVTVDPGAWISTASVSSTEGDLNPANNSLPLKSPADPRPYYLAEGSTGGFFDEDLLLANANGYDVPVTLSFLQETAPPIITTRTLAPFTRTTIRVDDLPGLEHAAPSTVVTSDNGLPIAVERTMRWDPRGYAAHTTGAAPARSNIWYFAEGTQGWFDTFLLLENPADHAIDVTMKFLREYETPVVHVQPMAPHQRITLGLGTIPQLVGRTFGMVVTTADPAGIVAERSMYFGSTADRPWRGGHVSAGVTTLSPRWFFAEGATGGFFDTYILLANPQAVDAHVTLTYLLPDGTSIESVKVVPAEGRLTVGIEEEADPRLKGTSVSTQVSSDVPIVSERSMYWLASGPGPWSEGHNSFGATETSPRWSLAEGRVGGPQDARTYVLLSNPWNETAQVELIILREQGDPLFKQVEVPPHTRVTYDVRVEVPELQDEAFGVDVNVENNLTISVERALYWNTEGVFWSAGTSATAAKLPVVRFAM